MTIARKEIVLEDKDGMYHCISRCVRRCFLCGKDTVLNKNYEHRRKWVQERLKKLSQIFCIDVLSYAVMSNHLHILLRTNYKKLILLNDDEIVRRWRELYPIRGNDNKKESALFETKERILEMRKRLGNLSWFMKSVSENIARRANKEDECSGRFWEGRFICKRVFDEASALQCSLYIDLNPIRAKIADTPEKSIFTSAYERILEEKEKARRLKNHRIESGKKVTNWITNIDKKEGGFLSMNQKEYLLMLDYVGREIRENKKGRIPKELESILVRLKINTKNWVDNLGMINKNFSRFIANKENMILEANKIGQKWFRGVRVASLLFS